MEHPSLIRWETQLKAVFDKIDDFLEEKYGRIYPLHPARLPRGTAANREHDGLFNVGASFSAGFGSEIGPGYIVEIRMATLAKVPPEVQRQIESDVMTLLKQELDIYFPNKILEVNKDGNVYKIHGDLSLGQV